MKLEKSEILKNLSPKAILIPLTKEATGCILQNNFKDDIIPLLSFPHRFGRESRIDSNEQGFFLKLRLFKTKKDSSPNNDTYLIDKNLNSQISKEHFVIDKKENGFFISDRKSRMGMVINGKVLAGNKQEATSEIYDGDIIKVGSEDSDFKFQFLILED